MSTESAARMLGEAMARAERVLSPEDYQSAQQIAMARALSVESLQTATGMLAAGAILHALADWREGQ